MTLTAADEHPVSVHTGPAGHVVHCREHGRINIPTDPAKAEMVADLHELTEHREWV